MARLKTLANYVFDVCILILEARGAHSQSILAMLFLRSEGRHDSFAMSKHGVILIASFRKNV